MSFIKKKTSSGWSDVPIKVKKKGSWVDVDVYKRLNGRWVKLTSQKYTKTWEATWTQTYRESGTKRTDYRSEKICQGRYVVEPWGIMKSLIGFPDMNTTLSGSKIEDVKIYLRNEHWYYQAGGKAVIGYHNHSSKPSTFSHSKYAAKTESYSSRGQAKWIDMPNSFGEGLRDGKYEGFSIYANSTNMNFYGVFYGVHDGSSKPKIKITYTK
ncbi:hypothetical protein P8891_06015 [Bacillus atrophaeus]|uniref:hypothetical protein n=1 Tax=Bacillus atrophaeus TaxID=1452 RepID=UPI0022831B52|nr:hypothetical protein [Bacillus atrophaeus]MCY7948673.1 hypothetical protein [Bacillus atrophaeus]MCY8098388.1 hypothetical protein [Bacillus atrophaeus]MCY9169913.1 hypothetical protein [Bacillus atrophaeus]MEC0740638.1 hypothetical protein [Bacillus atrophaeus]MEC0747098.1 hypothetical protein [Bacillus atrophaeus]